MQYFLWGEKMKKKKWNHGEKLIHVKSIEDLNKVREIDQDLYQTVILILDKDLNFNLKQFEPIDARNLNVIIRGNNHNLWNLYIRDGKKMEVGLFSRTKDFQIFDIDNFTNFVLGESCVGALVGSVNGNAIVSNVKADAWVNGESHCGGLFGTTKKITVSDSSVYSIVEGKDIVGGLVGMCDQVELHNTEVVPRFEKIEGKAVGTIAGYDSSKMEEKVNQMLVETLPYLEPKPTIEEEEIFGLRR